MTADDLTAPLSRRLKKRSKINLPATPIIFGALALFLAIFVLWAIIADDPFGGEPVAVVSADMHVVAAKPPTMLGSTPSPLAQPQQAAQGPDAAAPTQGQGQSSAGAQGNTTTITIIDGKTGERKEVAIPAPANDATPAPDAGPFDQKFLEMSAHGAIPKITADGIRPADA
ncbi:MAG: hypothetical protein WBD33_19560, partial [Xanthobacteraceae bacterium]